MGLYLNKANFILISALVDLESPEELHQQPQFFQNHYFFLESHFRVVGFCQPWRDRHHHNEGELVHPRLRSHQEFLFKTPEGSSMPLGFSSQLSGSWNKIHFIRRLNHRTMESLWLVKIFQIIKMIWNIAIKFGITCKAQVSSKTHPRVSSGALVYWFFSVNTKGNATFGAGASLCACLTLCGCQKMIFSVFFVTL